MARTRGASRDEGGVMLDREGKPISPAALNLHKVHKLAGNVVLHGPGVEPVPVPPPIVSYRCTKASVARNMEAYELLLLLDAAMPKGFVLDITQEQFASLSGNLRRHFLPVRQDTTVS